MSVLSQVEMEKMAKMEPERLAGIILTTQDRVTLTFAAEAARGTANAVLLEAVLGLAAHPKAFVREGAVLGLRGSHDPRARAVVEALSQGDPDEDVRDVALEVLKDWI